MPAPVAGAPLSGQAVKWNCFTIQDLLSVDYRMVGVCLSSIIDITRLHIQYSYCNMAERKGEGMHK